MPAYSNTFPLMRDKTGNEKAIKCFIAVLIVCTAFSYIAIRRKSELQHLSIERMVIGKGLEIHKVISNLVYKTQALSTFVIQNNGDLRGFERIAATLVDDPAILNVLIAPNGVVSHVYPLVGNELVVGYNLLGVGLGNKEAAIAKEKGQLVFGGPFELVQQRKALVGRLPVLLDTPDGEGKFWGLVSVALKYPQALAGARLDLLEAEGLSYEIWRTNPDNGQRQIIISNGPEVGKAVPYIERAISIFNADWYFRVMPIPSWYEHPDNWLRLLTGLCISILMAIVVKKNAILHRMKADLEEMVRTDALTGVLNRVGLFHQLKNLLQKQTPIHIYYLDLNHFKQINDTFGHTVGDQTLKEFCHRFRKHLAPHCTFARISGDEFVLVQAISILPSAQKDVFWEKIRKEFAKPILGSNGTSFQLSFSMGHATFPEDGKTIDELITHADARMYEQKRSQYSKEKKRRTTDQLPGLKKTARKD